MLFNRNVEISFSNENIQILDVQLKICNWLYNKFLDKDILRTTLGKDENNKQICVNGHIKENLNLRDSNKIKIFIFI